MRESPLLPPLLFPGTSVKHEHASVPCLCHTPHKKAACQSFTSRSYSQNEGQKKAILFVKKPARLSLKRANLKQKEARSSLRYAGWMRIPSHDIQTAGNWKKDSRSRNHLYARPCCALPTLEQYRPAVHWSRTKRRGRARLYHVTCTWYR